MLLNNNMYDKTDPALIPVPETLLDSNIKKKNNKSLKEQIKSRKRNQITDFPYKSIFEFRKKNEMKKFINMQDVYYTLIYLFSPPSLISQLSYFSIIQDLLSQPRSFLWKDYLIAYRELKDFTFRNDVDKLHPQVYFFSTFTTNIINAEDRTIMFSPYNCQLEIIPSLDSNFRLSTDILDEQTKITIIPENIRKVKTNKDFRTREQIGIDASIRESLKEMGISSSFFLIEKIRILLSIIRSSRFYKIGFQFTFCFFAVEQICNDLGLGNLYHYARMGRLQKIIDEIATFLNYKNLGVIFFQKPLKKKSFIIIEVNKKNLNEGFWFLNSSEQEPCGWSKLESHILRSGLPIEEVFRIFENFDPTKKMYDYKIEEVKLIKYLFNKNNLINIKTEEKKIDDFISFEIETVPVYTQRTSVGFRNRLSQQGEKKILLLAIDFRNKSKFISNFFKLLNSLEDFFSSKKDLNFNRKFVKYQNKFLFLVNNYYTSINKIILEEGNPVLSEVKSYFDKKFALEKRKKKFVESDWFSKNYEFTDIFPVGYFFSSLKKKEKGKKLSTFISRFDRLEEERSKGVAEHTAIISFPRDFRKSFQANLANAFFSSKLYALDIDMSSLHMNLMLSILGKDPKYVVEWDILYNQFVEELKKNSISETFIKKNKINRSFIKQFFLSLLNGRKLLEFNLFSTYGGEFLKIQKDSKAKKFFKLMHNFVKNSFLYKDCLEFQKKILSMEKFMGTNFEITINTSDENSMKEKINIVLQYLESLLLSALFYDLSNERCIIHSLERDGLVVFLSLEQIKNLKFPFFREISKKIFNSRVKLSLKILVSKDDDKVKIFADRI